MTDARGFRLQPEDPISDLVASGFGRKIRSSRLTSA